MVPWQSTDSAFPFNTQLITCWCMPFSHRKAAHRRPASAAVHSSAAASAHMGDIVDRPASLPVSHWSQHQRHHHAIAHPHLRQDLRSTMHFSRPRSAQPWVSKHEKDAAAECSSSPRLKDKHVQSISPPSSCATPVQLQAHCADNLSSSLHNDAPENSTAASTSAHQAPSSAATEAETVCEQSSQASIGDVSNRQEVHLEHLETSCQPEASSHALSPDISRFPPVVINTQDASSMEQSMQQSWSKGHLGLQDGSHRKTRMREWPPQGARWRSASHCKLQANPMHLPTAKVCSCSPFISCCQLDLCLTCGLAVSHDQLQDNAVS